MIFTSEKSECLHVRSKKIENYTDIVPSTTSSIGSFNMLSSTIDYFSAASDAAASRARAGSADVDALMGKAKYFELRGNVVAALEMLQSLEAQLGSRQVQRAVFVLVHRSSSSGSPHLSSPPVQPSMARAFGDLCDCARRCSCPRCSSAVSCCSRSRRPTGSTCPRRRSDCSTRTPGATASTRTASALCTRSRTPATCPPYAQPHSPPVVLVQYTYTTPRSACRTC